MNRKSSNKGSIYFKPVNPPKNKYLFFINSYCSLGITPFRLYYSLHICYYTPTKCFLFQEDKPFLFFVKDVEISSTLQDALDIKKLNTEEIVEIIYQQQAVFRVRPVTRCTRYLNIYQFTYELITYWQHNTHSRLNVFFKCSSATIIKMFLCQSG